MRRDTCFVAGQCVNARDTFSALRENAESQPTFSLERGKRGCVLCQANSKQYRTMDLQGALQNFWYSNTHTINHGGQKYKIMYFSRLPNFDPPTHMPMAKMLHVR